MNKYLCSLLSLTCMTAHTLTAQINSVEATEGWDIYTAGSYRYGPSFITNDDGTIDAWFAAPGQEYEDCMLYDTTSGNTAMKVKNTNFVAQYIKINRPFVGFSFYCPTWATPNQNLRLSIYKWNESITESQNGTPLAQKTHTGVTDNQLLSVTTDNFEPLPAGEYVLVLDNASASAGVYWYYKANPDFNGSIYVGKNKYTGSIRGHILYDSKMIMQYWDQVSYRHSYNGGLTWTAEQMVLKPTRFTRDEYSICDPGVAYWGGYYYIGYTSTENAGGIENHLYVARSEYPDGPWEKWDGTGWNGDAQPIVEYTHKGGWGIGEPSLVVKDNTVYVYYTYDQGTPSTRLSTAPADREDWPAHLTHKGTVISKSAGSDHCDVKYVDAARRFLAVHTSKRMTKDAYIQMWQSEDGEHFEPVGDGRMQGIIYPSGLHNCGLNGDARGHIDITKPQHIAFAYGLDAAGNSAWGAWSTFLQPITIKCNTQSGIESVSADNDKPVRMFNMQGVEVDPQTTSPGLYIRQQGKRTEKILHKK